MSKSVYLTFILLLILSSVCKAQDVNHYKSLYLCSYYHKYDSLKGYFYYHQVGFNDKLIGVSQREYHAPDTIAGYIDYMSLIRDEQGKSRRKGIYYEMHPNGVFFGLGYLDWNAEKHGNVLDFRSDGTLKENNLYDRGVLLDKWRYNEEGELLEHVEYRDNE